jgi:hypothetical protein
MPDFLLARFAVVLENGHADHGTGHTPTIDPGRFQLSRSRFWTKFRRETQESTLPAKASGRSVAEVQPDIHDGSDRDISALCT